MPRQPGAAIMCKEHQVPQGPSRLESVISLAKRRGFVFPCGDIYGGTRSAWDYGPLGVELKENRLMCPGYCGEYLRPDWRFGMSGQRKYSMELRERATRMALEARADPSRRKGAIKRISGQLGINPEALRTWVRAVEQGGRNERGEVSDQEARIRALEAENRELRRANEILKAASAFFGAELDRLAR